MNFLSIDAENKDENILLINILSIIIIFEFLINIILIIIISKFYKKLKRLYQYGN